MCVQLISRPDLLYRSKDTGLSGVIRGCATPERSEVNGNHFRRSTGADAYLFTGYRRDMNVVSLIGNLATDVELKAVGDGKQVAGFLLAINRPSKDGGADFVHISVWDRQAELCSEYLAKGQRVGVEGRLRSRSWDAEDGSRRNALEVVAGRVEFLSPPEGGAATDADIPFAAAVA
jgi:single-strand DNA-binding protein